MKSTEMTQYLIPFLIIFLHHVFCKPDKPTVTLQNYLDWKSRIICGRGTEEARIRNENRVKDLCYKLAQKYSSTEKKDTIIQKSECRGASMRFGTTITDDIIAMCYVSRSVTKCMIKGEGEKDLVVFDYKNSICEVEKIITENSLNILEPVPAWKIALKSIVKILSCGYIK